jgi:uncharacterized membrane protein
MENDTSGAVIALPILVVVLAGSLILLVAQRLWKHRHQAGWRVRIALSLLLLPVWFMLSFGIPAFITLVIAESLQRFYVRDHVSVIPPHSVEMWVYGVVIVTAVPATLLMIWSQRIGNAKAIG